MNEYFFEMARTYHTTKSLNWFSALANVSNAQLTAIKEEDEDATKEEVKKTNDDRSLFNTQVKVC